MFIKQPIALQHSNDAVMPSKKQQTSTKRKKPPDGLLIEENDAVSEAGQNSNSKSRG